MITVNSIFLVVAVIVTQPLKIYDALKERVSAPNADITSTLK